MNDESKKQSAPAKPSASRLEPPAQLTALDAMAHAYKGYVAYLKEAGPSGITGQFGKLNFQEKSQVLELITTSAKHGALQRDLATKPKAPIDSDSCTIEDKMQAIFEILTGSTTLQDISQHYGVDEARVRKWVEIAFQGIEAALRAEASAD